MPTAILLAAALAAAPPPVSGDFDHDGLADRAEFIEAAHASGYVLAVRRGAQTGRMTSVRTLRKLDGAYVEVVPAGKVVTACGKRVGERRARCGVGELTLAGDTLGFGTDTGAYGVALWNGRRFEVVWLVD